MGKKIVFDSEDGQNAANKNGPRQIRNPNVNRLSSYMLQERENGVDCKPIKHEQQSEPDI